MYCLQNRLFLLLTFSFIAMSQTYAEKKSNTTQSTIDIKAQYLLLDEQKGISKYKGNVQFTKDTLIIKADTITLHYDGEKLTKALIIGSPADVQHQPINEAKVHSQANTMEYFVSEDRLLLKGNAFVDQGERHFSGEYIEYDTRQRTIMAAGGNKTKSNKETSKMSQPKERVHVIIGSGNNSLGSKDK